MDEFVNRMGKQREVLEIVNSKYKGKEELCGLSKKSIDRWLQINSISSNDIISTLLFNISEKLFLLACKSQEQISDDYKNISSEVSFLQNELTRILV